MRDNTYSNKNVLLDDYSRRVLAPAIDKLVDKVGGEILSGPSQLPAPLYFFEGMILEDHSLGNLTLTLVTSADGEENS